MKYFDKFVSNTLAGSANQSWFESENEVVTGRVFYKIFKGGKYNYSLLFSNIIDSTFSDGTHSHKNLVCDEWEIISASVCVTKTACCDQCGEFKNIAFDGKKSKMVMPGEFFTTDPIEISAEKGDYFCIEMSVKGRMMPYHPEIIIPVFRKTASGWEENVQFPVPSMIGIEDVPKLKVGFLGDSITQGIGTEKNSYAHWNSRVADMIGEDYSWWNLGIGFGRGDDAATDGAWLFKAKQVDVVVVCFGVNDIIRGFDEAKLKENLQRIVDKLRGAGCRVLVQTVPPFDFCEERENLRRKINNYILKELDADCVFDNNPILADGNRSIYGGHPNAEGCKKWAQGLCLYLKNLFQRSDYI